MIRVNLKRDELGYAIRQDCQRKINSMKKHHFRRAVLAFPIKGVLQLFAIFIMLIMVCLVTLYLGEARDQMRMKNQEAYERRWVVQTEIYNKVSGLNLEPYEWELMGEVERAAILSAKRED